MVEKKTQDKKSELEKGIRWEKDLIFHKTEHGLWHSEKDGVISYYAQLPKHKTKKPYFVK